MASATAGRASDHPVRRTLFRWALRLVVITYLVLLVAWPVSLVATKTFENWDTFGDLFSDPDTVHALKLTVIVAVSAVIINTVFGVIISLLLVRYEFRGKRILSPLIDLPMAVSPIVVGLALVLVYGGRDGWFGPWLEANGFQVIFALPGMIMATTFVALPLVVRELVPVLEEVGVEQEQAAASLGAGPLQTFWRITLPAIKWALVYGVVLSLARSLGEFGALKVVSGNILGETRTATLVVEEKYLNFDQAGAYATAFLLTMVSVACIVIVTIIRPKEDRER